MSHHKLQLLVFDLDGTLIDSSKDLAGSVNATLHHYQVAPLGEEQIATYIGDGASMLVRRALAEAFGEPPSEEFAAEALDFFLAHYRVHKLDNTYVYDGVIDSLKAIRAAHPHIEMAVLTNKPVRPSREICAALGLGGFFFQNYGGDSFVTKKLDPEGLNALMGEAAVLDPKKCIMVGDSHVDIKTAQAAGTRSLGCLYGLSPDSLRDAEPDMLAETPRDWPALIDEASR